MPPRGLALFVPPSGSSRQNAAVRQHLRSEEFWTRRKRNRSNTVSEDDPPESHGTQSEDEDTQEMSTSGSARDGAALASLPDSATLASLPESATFGSTNSQMRADPLPSLQPPGEVNTPAKKPSLTIDIADPNDTAPVDTGKQRRRAHFAQEISPSSSEAANGASTSGGGQSMFTSADAHIAELIMKGNKSNKVRQGRGVRYADEEEGSSEGEDDEELPPPTFTKMPSKNRKSKTNLSRSMSRERVETEQADEAGGSIRSNDGEEVEPSERTEARGGEMALLLSCLSLQPGHCARLLKEPTLEHLSIDRLGKTVIKVETLADFKNGDWRKRRLLIHKTLMDPTSSRVANFLSIFILLVILLSSVTFCMETLPMFTDNSAMGWIESVCIWIFTLEYVVKLTTAPHVWEFIRGPLNIIDLIAIVPWYVELFTGNRDQQGASVLRVIRLARIFKLGGRYGKFQVVAKAMITSLDVLGVLLFLMIITVVIFSTLIYYCEQAENEDNDKMASIAFASIPESFWWAMVTVNTVGYGDIVPVTVWGRVVACGLMVVGLLIMALPISVIGTNFTQEWLDYKDYLSQREAMKHLPPKVILFEELMTEHVSNVEDIINRYSETEAELDYLRMKLQDKIHQKRAEIDQHQRRSMESMNSAGGHSDEDVAAGPRHVAFARLFGKDKAVKMGDRSMRELAEVKDLEQAILQKSAYLRDLLLATEFLRSDQFEEKVKTLRMKYKQLEFMKEEDHSIRSAIDEAEKQVREVDPNIEFVNSTMRTLSQFDGLSNMTPTMAWQKIKRYSQITKLASRKRLGTVTEDQRQDLGSRSSAGSDSATLLSQGVPTTRGNDHTSRKSTSDLQRPKRFVVLRRSTLQS